MFLTLKWGWNRPKNITKKKLRIKKTRYGLYVSSYAIINCCLVEVHVGPKIIWAVS